MNDLRSAIRYKYQKTFKHCHDFSIGRGWIDMVDKLTAKLIRLYPKIKVTQIKEKFGTLRYYIDVVPLHLFDQIHDEISKIEKLSAITCEDCGTTRKVKERIINKGWYRTLCDSCNDKCNKERKE